jgi:hypothetical protein
MTDARFEDGDDRPLKLQALDGDDLKILSALVQDAVFPVSEMAWDAKRRRFAILLNRFRWEYQARASGRGDFERVQSLLVFSDVLSVASAGIDRGDKDVIVSLLAVEFQPGEDGAGHVMLFLAGDGEIRLSVECLDAVLSDVTQPYRAVSGRAPEHKV